MEKYGTILVPINEEVHEFGEEDSDDEEVGTGNFVLTMKIAKQIPQFLPMWGKKVEIYYRGMPQLCLHCYRPGHRKIDCKNERIEWMDYVCKFIETNDYYKEIYGRWFEIAKKHMRSKRRNDPEQPNPANQNGPGVRENTKANGNTELDQRPQRQGEGDEIALSAVMTEETENDVEVQPEAKAHGSQEPVWNTITRSQKKKPNSDDQNAETIEVVQPNIEESVVGQNYRKSRNYQKNTTTEGVGVNPVTKPRRGAKNT